ncbi:velvet factor [Thamnocephalis sphaerospora]|uniref:Velvet factor n=1 Tax=Thamnocephalis sphaerospora TaxID=78915 RepID=A0A4P9XSX7_9FUNG|nr:velvet factor [Thamnocephalis sphaerospora]|eukprot:RKP09082.1 velvet factor [Thamnocephalis sphaerospora]
MTHTAFEMHPGTESLPAMPSLTQLFGGCTLTVVQQPLRARMCGFGDKDRRPCTPPPIVRLSFNSAVNIEELDTSFFIVIADLWSPDTTTELNLVVHPSAPGGDNGSTTSCTRNLVGSLVASASKLYDIDGKLGVFFVFQDLSVRTEGQFRLKFSFANLACSPVSQVESEVFSEPFTVFSAKRFPGMIESTPLSRCFAKQGVKIPVRKDANRGGRSDD